MKKNSWDESCKMAHRILIAFPKEQRDEGYFYGALAILIALKTTCMPSSEREKFLARFDVCLAEALHEFKACDCFEAVDTTSVDIN
jgi:hypothetical protein